MIKIHKRQCLTIISVLLCCLFLSSCTQASENISAESEYIIIHSRSREKSSGIYCINGEGTITEKMKDSKMQDLSFFAFNDDMLLISGGRSNNNMLFHLSETGSYSEIYWLNEPQYSGVTAVELLSDSALVIMNGNFTDETYLNLVVEQDFNGNVIQKNTIELYTRGTSVYNDSAKFSGKHMSKGNGTNNWKASIIDYDIANQQIVNQYDYAGFNCFWEIIESDDSIYCLAEDENELINTVCVINKQTFELENQIKINDQLSGMYVDNDAIYVVGNAAIYRISNDAQKYEEHYVFEKTTDSYVDLAYMYGGNYYVFFRHSQRLLLDKEYEYGFLLKVDLNTLEVLEIPIRCGKKTTLDDILVFPAEMFVK